MTKLKYTLILSLLYPCSVWGASLRLKPVLHIDDSYDHHIPSKQEDRYWDLILLLESNGSLEEIKSVIEANPGFEHGLKDQSTVAKAIGRDREDVLSYLFDEKLDINAPTNDEGHPPVGLAIIMSRPRMLAFLVEEKGANPDYTYPEQKMFAYKEEYSYTTTRGMAYQIHRKYVQDRLERNTSGYETKALKCLRFFDYYDQFEKATDEIAKMATKVILRADEKMKEEKGISIFEMKMGDLDIQEEIKESTPTQNGVNATLELPQINATPPLPKKIGKDTTTSPIVIFGIGGVLVLVISASIWLKSSNGPKKNRSKRY